MARAEIIGRSLAARGACIRVRDLAEAAEISNRIAPEHLELSVAEPEQLLEAIRHAGAVFLGRHTPEAIGDYCAGPSHVLPTAGTARFASPLGVHDFQKRSSLIGCSPAGADGLAASRACSRSPSRCRRTRCRPPRGCANRETESDATRRRGLGECTGARRRACDRGLPRRRRARHGQARRDGKPVCAARGTTGAARPTGRRRGAEPLPRSAGDGAGCANPQRLRHRSALGDGARQRQRRDHPDADRRCVGSRVLRARPAPSS